MRAAKVSLLVREKTPGAASSAGDRRVTAFQPEIIIVPRYDRGLRPWCSHLLLESEACGLELGLLGQKNQI